MPQRQGLLPLLPIVVKGVRSLYFALRMVEQRFPDLSPYAQALDMAPHRPAAIVRAKVRKAGQSLELRRSFPQLRGVLLRTVHIRPEERALASYLPAPPLEDLSDRTDQRHEMVPVHLVADLPYPLVVDHADFLGHDSRRLAQPATRSENQHVHVAGF